MNEFIKRYKIKIRALSPIHVGNGEKIGKKEYINLLWDHKVIIPDLIKMYTDICKAGLEKEYIKYMLNEQTDLGIWLKKHDFQKKDYQRWKRYELDSGDALSGSPVGRQVRTKEIMCITKDAYGLPFIPGSSLKGMIRTALLAYEIKQNPEKYREVCTSIKNNVRQFTKRDQCLSRETSDLETMAFHTLGRDEKKKGNAVNSCLSGLIVSDSKPISADCLILCRKQDEMPNGTVKELNILRECIRPGTKLEFHITIDSTLYKGKRENILRAVRHFGECYMECFSKKFSSGDSMKGAMLYLGGGSGYVSKTVTYPLFGEKGVEIISKILNNTLPSKLRTQHRHGVW